MKKLVKGGEKLVKGDEKLVKGDGIAEWDLMIVQVFLC